MSVIFVETDVASRILKRRLPADEGFADVLPVGIAPLSATCWTDSLFVLAGGGALTVAVPSFAGLSPAYVSVGIVGSMPTMEQPEEPRLLVLSPEQALAAARPLPDREHMMMTDVSDDEWATFFAALKDA